MTSPIDATARLGLATRTLRTVRGYSAVTTEAETDGPAAALRDVERDAARLGFGPLGAAAGLAHEAARVSRPDADLWQHALDVLGLVCLAELQEAEGGGRVDLDDVLDALRQRVEFHGRAAQLSPAPRG